MNVNGEGTAFSAFAARRRFLFAVVNEIRGGGQLWLEVYLLVISCRLYTRVGKD
jgi:hypothetical protein